MKQIFIALLMQGKKSLQTNDEILKNLTEEKIRIHIKKYLLQFINMKTYDKTIFETFDNCKSEQIDLPFFNYI